MNVKRIFYFLLVLSLLVACEDKNRVVKPNDGPAHLRMIEQEYDFGNVDSYKDVLTHEFSFVNDGKSGRYLGAQHFAGMTLEKAVRKAESVFDSPY